MRRGRAGDDPSDLARWDISLINESLLSPASYRRLKRDVRLKNGTGTGYGLGVDVGMMGGHHMVSHSGEVSGFTAYNAVFPDDSAAVVVLTNQDAAPASGAIGRGRAAALRQPRHGSPGAAPPAPSGSSAGCSAA